MEKHTNGNSPRERLLETVVDLTVHLDDGGTVRAVDGPLVDLLGYERSAVLGDSVTTLLGSEQEATGTYEATAACPDELLAAGTTPVSVLFETADGDHCAGTATREPTDEGTLCAISLATLSEPTGAFGRETDHTDAVADPVCVFGPGGRIKRVNDAMAEYTGYTRGELLGRKLGELVPADEYDRASTIVRELAQSDAQSTIFETSLVTSYGQLVRTEASIGVVTDRNDSFTGFIATLRDVGDRAERERDLELTKQVLSRLVRHNLRNELNIVLGHGELLEEQLSDGRRQSAEKIVQTTEQLIEQSKKARLIERVIDTSTEDQLAIADCLRSIVAEYREEHPEATITLDIDTDTTVETHPEMPTGIEELVDNAIRHASGPPHVLIQTVEHDEFVTLFVEDESGGIDDEELQRLRDGDETKLEHTSGVGLWLVRWLVEYSDAALVTQQTEAGSVMGIRFPKAGSTVSPVPDTDSAPIVAAPEYAPREAFDGRLHDDTLIGRMDEIHELERIYEAIETSGGQAVFVTGETGIGKTALVEGFTTRVETYDNQPLIGTSRCRPDRTTPYRAVRDALASLPVQQQFEELIADLSTIADDEQTTPPKQVLFTDVADRLRELALDHPVVLVFEDLHLADPGTLDLLTHLRNEVGQWALPILFVGTATGHATDSDGLSKLIEADVNRTHRIDLDPLTRADVETVVAYHLGMESVPDRLVDAVYEHTGGIPLFVAEASNHVRSVLGPDPSPSALPTAVDELGLPESIDSAVRHRRNNLSSPAQSLLDLGALAGETVSLSVLAAASELDEDSFESCVNELVRKRFWERRQGSVLFVHSPVRTAVVDQIDADRAPSLHDRLASAIETVYADQRADQYGRLATHYDKAGATKTAIEYYRRAGEQAENRFANEIAVERYERAVELCSPSLAASDRAELFARLAAAYRAVGSLDAAAATATDALDVAPSGSETQCQALDTLATVRNGQGSYEEARGLTERQRALAQELGNQSLEGAAIRRLGALSRRQGDYDASREYYQACLELSRATGDRQLTARCVKGLAAIEHSAGSYDQAFEYAQRGVELSREIGDPRHEARALTTLGAICSSRGEYERATEYYEESLAIKRTLSDRLGQARTRSNLGLVAQRQGDYDRAREQYEASLDIAHSLEDPKGKAYSLHNLGDVARYCGQYDRARQQLEQSLELVREIGDRRVEAANLTLLGDVHLRKESFESADERYREAIDIAREIDLSRWLANANRGLAELERRQENVTAAADAVQRALSFSEEIGDRSGQARARLELGRIHLERGNYDRAEEAAVRARNAFDELDASHWLARADRLLGRTDLHRRDVSAAFDCLWTAVETFEQLGATDDALGTLRMLVTTSVDDVYDKQRDQARDRAHSICSDAPDCVIDRHRSWLVQHNVLPDQKQ